MRIHFVGVCGVSMRRLSEIAAAKDYTVTGSDVEKGGHKPENVSGADLVVYTAAVGQDNCELARAREQGIPVMERAEFLGRIAGEYRSVIAISGSHGKTTASAMTSEIFKERNPTVHIGGDYPSFTGTGGTEFFITEACEYKRSFLRLNPDFSVVLNAELDHTDCYRNKDEYFAAFRQFCAQSKSAAVFGDDADLASLARRCGYTTFGWSEQNDYTARNISLTTGGRAFDLYERGQLLTRAQINVAGAHNVLNALAASAAARRFGLSAREITEGLARFCAVGRRFEFLGERSGARVYSDYAHHPTEIAATVRAAREIGAEKVIIIFEPHTYSRTQSLYQEFAESLAGADEVFLMPIYAAREQPQAGVTSCLIAEELQRRGKSAVCCASYDALFAALKNTAGNHCAAVFTGAGTIDRYARAYSVGAEPGS